MTATLSHGENRGSSPLGSTSKINVFTQRGEPHRPLKRPFQEGHRLVKSPRAGLFKSGSSSDRRLDIDDGFFSLIAFDDLDLLRPCSCDLAREFISRALENNPQNLGSLSIAYTSLDAVMGPLHRAG